eukprot:scaffold34644_cov283-Amphora_coffeaeformis.AAC.4
MTNTRVVLWLLPLLLLVFFLNDPVMAWTALPRPMRSTTTTTESSRLFQATSSSSSNNTQKKQSAARSVTNLERWAERVGIQKSPTLKLDQDPTSGFGWTATTDIATNQVLLQVPTDVALTVACPGEGPNDARVLRQCVDRKAFRDDLPWYAQFSAYLHVLKQQNNDDGRDVQAWLDSLPRVLDTPLHWKTDGDDLSELQYDFLTKAVAKQRTAWQGYHQALQDNGFADLSYDDFVWGCEMARSRAFSGAYTGGAFNPAIYAFTLALVAVYIGLGLGTIEQAANGAGVVFCATVLKDFVFPKLFKSKKYAICPLIDMANHQSVGLQALERAGLLGYANTNDNGSDSDDKKQAFDENAANADGGVVVTRAVGLDPAVWQALRALFCTDAEWQAAGQAVGSFAESSPSTATEKAVREAAKCALEWELARKATTLEQDVALQQRQANSKAVDASTAETLALAFRIEKKKLLQECLKMIA